MTTSTSVFIERGNKPSKSWEQLELFLIVSQSWLYKPFSEALLNPFGNVQPASSKPPDNRALSDNKRNNHPVNLINDLRTKTLGLANRTPASPEDLFGLI